MKYFDNASTTKISKESLNAYIQASEVFYNPSSLYLPSVEAKNLIEASRKTILEYLNAKPKSTLIFTGSASESNNAVLNATITRKDKKYIFSAGEHSSIYETAKKYKEQGYNVVFVSLNKNGSVNIEELLNEVDDSTALVSVIFVSNETGAVNDIKNLTQKIKKKNTNTIVHTDGVQALGKININLQELGVDYFTLSAHKINGPKGVGGLYIANPNKFKPFISGGPQEMNLRAGTENTPAICAFAEAVKNLKISDFSEHKKEILKALKGDYVLISDENCVDNIISMCFSGVRGETIEHMLETKGFLIGTGSSCNSKLGKNRVLSSIVSPKYIEGAIRLSFDDSVEISDCKQVAIEISNAVEEYKKRIRR